MSLFVVDASVAMKWLLPEPGAADAMRLQSPAHALHAPAFLDVEVANVLWKSIRQGRLTRAEADVRFADALAWPIPRHPDDSLLPSAFDLPYRAHRLRLPVFGPGDAARRKGRDCGRKVRQ